MVVDLHNSIGVLAVSIMLVLAVTGAARPVVKHPSLRPMISLLHTTEGFPTPIKVLYAVGSMGFMVQGVTGLLMWWRPRRRESDG